MQLVIYNSRCMSGEQILQFGVHTSTWTPELEVYLEFSFIINIITILHLIYRAGGAINRCMENSFIASRTVSECFSDPLPHHLKSFMHNLQQCLWNFRLMKKSLNIILFFYIICDRKCWKLNFNFHQKERRENIVNIDYLKPQPLYRNFEICLLVGFHKWENFKEFKFIQ